MQSNVHIKHLKKSDPVMGRLIRKISLKSLPLQRNYFQSLAVAIINQQLSTKAADTIERRFVGLFNAKNFPTPEQVLKVRISKIRKAGLSAAKASYIKNLARFVISRQKELKNINKLSDEKVVELLTEIKGIGKWTAEMFLIFSLGRADVFSHGDLGLRSAIKKLYKLRKDPDFKKTKKISDLWKPYRSYASRYLWASLSQK